LLKQCGKDKIDISTIIPDGMEPHDFEPKAKDIANLSVSNVFIYNGFDMEPWVDNAISSANNPNLISVEASKGVVPILNTNAQEITNNEQYDPHIWLSLKDAEIEVINIKNALIQADPVNKDYYEKNCSDYIAELENLFNEYSVKFQSVTNKNIVTGHAAFAYLCRDFGLTQNSVEDVFASGEPSGKQLAELVNYCRENNVKTIFTEKMISQDISNTLANEVGAKVTTIYTIESNEDNKTYLERMTENLSEIYASLNQ